MKNMKGSIKTLYETIFETKYLIFELLSRVRRYVADEKFSVLRVDKKFLGRFYIGIVNMSVYSQSAILIISGSRDLANNVSGTYHVTGSTH